MFSPTLRPDAPANPYSDATTRLTGRLVPALTLLIFSVWLTTSIAAILLTLSDALPAARFNGTIIAELDR